MSKRQVIIRQLCTVGHSPAKALEIAIEAERGDEHATKWVDYVKGWLDA